MKSINMESLDIYLSVLAGFCLDSSLLRPVPDNKLFAGLARRGIRDLFSDHVGYVNHTYLANERSYRSGCAPAPTRQPSSLKLARLAAAQRAIGKIPASLGACALLQFMGDMQCSIAYQAVSLCQSLHVETVWGARTGKHIKPATIFSSFIGQSGKPEATHP